MLGVSQFFDTRKRGGEIINDRWMELKLKKLKGAAVQHQKKTDSPSS